MRVQSETPVDEPKGFSYRCKMDIDENSLDMDMNFGCTSYFGDGKPIVANYSYKSHPYANAFHREFQEMVSYIGQEEGSVYTEIGEFNGVIDLGPLLEDETDMDLGELSEYGIPKDRLEEVQRLLVEHKDRIAADISKALEVSQSQRVFNK